MLQNSAQDGHLLSSLKMTCCFLRKNLSLCSGGGNRFCIHFQHHFCVLPINSPIRWLIGKLSRFEPNCALLLYDGIHQCHIATQHEFFDIDQDQHALIHGAQSQDVVVIES